jgi:uncharacterized protein (TIGR00661 family)
MLCNIAFYVHHHGSGHIMRCLAIAKHLKNCSVTFLGSDLEKYAHLIPVNIRCIHLKMDTNPNTNFNTTDSSQVAGLHYAPLNIQGQRERVLQLTSFFNESHPLLLVVDVSVEVAMLARLSGIPYIYIKQHGNRQDIAHEIAYKNAEAVIAPFDAKLELNTENWLIEKTFYSGNFSRFTNTFIKPSKVYNNVATIMIGAGGSSIDSDFMYHLSQTCTNWQFNVIGDLNSSDMLLYAENVTLMKRVDDVSEIINYSEVIIGNTGHNTVMEIATFGKPYIAIPEERPFEEQAVKARALGQLDLAIVVKPTELFTADWPVLLHKAKLESPDWERYNNDNALDDISNFIEEIYTKIFDPATSI